jgi:hypothetical protein
VRAEATPAHELDEKPGQWELRMREWSSIVPGAPEDYCIVINRYGRFGTAFAETGLDRANYETTIGRSDGRAAQ